MSADRTACQKCFGVGELECPRCAGDKSCSTCLDTGSVSCDGCDGKGSFAEDLWDDLDDGDGPPEHPFYELNLDTDEGDDDDTYGWLGGGVHDDDEAANDDDGE